CLVFAQWIEVGIGPSQRAILGIYRDGSLDVRDGFGQFAPLSVRNREHIQCVIVVRILIADETEMQDSFVVASTVERDRRRVQSLVDGLRSRFDGGDLAAADVQVQLYPLVELLLFGKLLQYCFESIRGTRVVMLLQAFKTAFVQCDSLEIRRSSSRRGRRSGHRR